MDKHGNIKNEWWRSYTRKDREMKVSWIFPQVIKNGIILLHWYWCFAECMMCTINDILEIIVTSFTVCTIPINRNWDVMDPMQEMEMLPKYHNDMSYVSSLGLIGENDMVLMTWKEQTVRYSVKNLAVILEEEFDNRSNQSHWWLEWSSMNYITLNGNSNYRVKGRIFRLEISDPSICHIF